MFVTYLDQSQRRCECSRRRRLVAGPIVFVPPLMIAKEYTFEGDRWPWKRQIDRPFETIVKIYEIDP